MMNCVGHFGEWVTGRGQRLWGICFVATVTETQQHVGNLDLLATAEFLQLSRQAKSKDAMWAVKGRGSTTGQVDSFGSLGQCTTKTNTHNQSKFMTSSPEIQLKHLIGTPINRRQR